MKKSIPFISLLLALLISLQSIAQPAVSSPDGQLLVKLFTNANGELFFTGSRNKQEVLAASPLGMITANADFSKGLKLLTPSAVSQVKDEYDMGHGKKSHIIYQANQRSFAVQSAQGKKMTIIFRLSNDGLAFRYAFDGAAAEPFEIKEEKTAYHFPAATRGFLQPKAEAQTGWEHTNPSYEEHYLQDIPMGTPAPFKAGWIYPALFKTGDTWLLFTETGMTGDYAATHLQNDSGSNLYHVAFPDSREVFTNQALISKAKLPWQSPWRIVAIGSLKTIAESTLGTDLAPAAMPGDWSWTKPGIASWSWINSKDDYIIASEQRKYIDFAANMHWKYCLVDADWDRKIGYDSIKALAAYAGSKGVGLLLWYNSAGAWNTVKYTPKDKLLTHEDRVKEFSRLQAMGIKGVKIDFFNGDGQSMMQYYNDILADAAQYKLLVNFHGATLPRGWARTWPNLMTMESVRGFEMITFGQADADKAATHSAMLPFTRNAFDPMDFTPMNLYKIQTKVQRKTTSAFELATSILFLSGIQHMAENPEGMAHVPAYVQELLRQLPTHWDEVKFLDGYPGKLVVMARRAGDRWYIAGINGENQAKTIQLKLDDFKQKKATLVTDGDEPLTFATQSIALTAGTQINIQPNGGFIIVF
jgi:alpha-glucosidase